MCLLQEAASSACSRCNTFPVTIAPAQHACMHVSINACVYQYMCLPMYVSTNACVYQGLHLGSSATVLPQKACISACMQHTFLSCLLHHYSLCADHQLMCLVLHPDVFNSAP